jgi:hypothetical protein
MWATAAFGVLAALSTGVRYYIDRRVGELSSTAQREREQNLKRQVEAAEQNQADANAKLAQIEKNVKGRHLTAAQSNAISEIAKTARHNLTGVVVTAANSNNEAQVYATEFVAALKAGGCNADLALPIPGLRPEVAGVHVAVHDLSNIPPEATELITILSGANVEFSRAKSEPNFFPELPMVLVVGSQ